jgi:glutamate carboxypeptidase
MSVWAKLRVGLGIAFLLFIGYTGVSGGLQQLPEAATLGQQIQTATQGLFGLLGLAVVATLGARRPWARFVRLVWAAVLSVSAGLATVVWGGTGLLPAMAATAATAAVAWLTLWALRPVTHASHPDPESSMSRPGVLIVALALAGANTLAAQAAVTPQERRIRDAIAAARADQIAYLQRVVDIPSSTLNLDGVRKVGAVFRASLDSLGFTTAWAAVPDATRRAGHLVADHRGKPGTVRILLIGHLDTVVEPTGPTFARTDSMAAGVGSGDMKGGDVVVLYALKALQAAGALKDLNLTLVFTGDEEHAGDPLAVSRRALLDAARRSDVALAFEEGSRTDVTVARRGASSWRVTASGRQAHSAGVFGQGAGYGAIYELARILDAFRQQLAGEEYLTFNVATILGGTDVSYDTVAVTGTAASKLNIIPKMAVAHGDLRFISEDQKERTRARMRAIVAQHLPGTDAAITFLDEYPAMSPTPGNARVLALYDTVSRALGYDAVVALDPGRRGAGDISFVAPLMDGLDGLGAMGGGAHTPAERVNLATLVMQTERAALLLRRLGARPAAEFARPQASGRQ